MSQENVEIVRRCTEYWANRDFSAIIEILDPNAVLDLSRNVFNPDVYRGVEGFRRWVENVGSRSGTSVRGSCCGSPGATGTARKPSKPPGCGE
jgi:hypothetical protein